MNGSISKETGTSQQAMVWICTSLLRLRICTHHALRPNLPERSTGPLLHDGKVARRPCAAALATAVASDVIQEEAGA